MKNKLWVTGGQHRIDGKRFILSSTEFVSKGVTTPGPDLPKTLYNHAIVALNESVYMIIGGVGPGFSWTVGTFYYYTDDKRWVAGPDLRQSRTNFAAGMVTDRVTNEKYAIVVGGFGCIATNGNCTSVASVEMLFPGNNAWKSGIYFDWFLVKTYSTNFCQRARITRSIR